MGERAVVDLRRELYGHLISQPMRFFGEHRVGELSSRLSNDLSQIQDTMTFTLAQIVRQTMMCLIGFVAIALTSLRLSLVMLASVPVLMLVAVLFGRRVRGLSKLAQDRLAETATIVEETFQGIANVKAFGNEPYESQRYAQGLGGYLTTVLRNARNRAALIAFVILGIFGAIVLVLWYGARLMKEGAISHGELTRFMFYTMFIGGAASSIPEIISGVQKTLGATQRVRELMREAPERHCDSGSAAIASAPRRRSAFFGSRFPLSLAAGASGAARALPARQAGRENRARRAERRGQIHDRLAPPAVLRAECRPAFSRRHKMRANSR